MHINMRNTGQNQKLCSKKTIENMLVAQLKENTRFIFDYHSLSQKGELVETKVKQCNNKGVLQNIC